MQIVLVPGGRESFDRCTTAPPVGRREFDVGKVYRGPCKDCVGKADFQSLPLRGPIRVTARMTESKRSEFRPQVEKEGCGQKMG
ncbi:hypothetical protein TNCV_3801041 [Trichonephila clavipes]|nr:hypothetical protein TNCV_3801041 [Trichonephila clavipes]